MINKWNEEGIVAISHRISDFVVYFPAIRKKDELIKLLEKLNKIKESVGKEFDVFTNAIKEKPNVTPPVEDGMNYAYSFGRINLLNSIIITLLEKIEDIEKESKLTEEDKKIVEESKSKEKDLSYVG